MWGSVMSICLFTEVAIGYFSTGMGDHFGELLVSLMALWLALVDQNSFQPCFFKIFIIDKHSDQILDKEM